MGIISLTLLALLFGGLLGGISISITLLITGIILLMVFKNLPVDLLVSQYSFNVLTTQELIALPLFILMGEILARTKLSRSLFDGLAPWAQLFPGRLLHVNIAASTIFAAISGSSAVTTQVVGRITLPELKSRGYAPSITVGSLAGAGTLGFLIPPSTVMIVYGVLAETSILRLFAAGIVPGLLVALCFSAYTALRTMRDPSLLPSDDEDLYADMSVGQRFVALKSLMPFVLLIFAILGAMYGGLASPSEAAACGVVGALIVAWLQGELSLPLLKDVFVSAVCSSSMIGMIVLGATILGHATAMLGIPNALTAYITNLGLPPYLLIAVLVLLYLLLGCFLESFSMLVLTVPLVLPLVQGIGFDAIWFGIFLVIVVEMSQITPPVGINLFILQGVSGRQIGEIARYALPYLLLLILIVAVLTVFPEIVLWLPDILLS